MKGWIIIKNNYVIDCVAWDGVTDFTYPFPHDTMLEATGDYAYAGRGDWYEASEDIFYRPLITPPDSPLYEESLNFPLQ